MPGTHDVELGALVVKRYRSEAHDEPRREWRALTLLAEYAPGLAPEPVRAGLTADPPVVVMTRLEGAPLRGRRLDALAEALDTLHRAIPAEVLRGVPRRAGHPREMLGLLRRRLGDVSPPGPALQARACDEAARWIARPGLERLLGEEPSPAFGTGDGNLANHLWDGARVRVVDFEYAGRGDRAYELAEAVEHITASAGDAIVAGDLLARFDLTRAERSRLTECRRLLALFWFLSALVRAPGGGAAERLAARLLGLLGGG
jgi:aminoglycoside phosphotransferase (APT) family kinase protein